MEILKIILISLFISTGISVNAQSLEKAFAKSYTLESARNYEGATNELLNVYDKKSYPLNIRLAWLYYLSKEYPKSSEYYDNCIKLKPLSIEALLGKTYPESVLGNWDKVISLYNQVLDLAPNNYTANLNLGQIYLNNAKYSDAEPHFKLLLSQYPFTYDIIINSAWNNFYLGKLREAKVLFNTALLLYPNNKSALEGLNKIK